MMGGISAPAFIVMAFLAMSVICPAAADSSGCSDSMQRMLSCLDYVTAKKADPTSDCCSAVKDMREHNVKCLCNFIQEVKKGDSPEVKNLGILGSKLDQLPKACNMNNTDTSQCSMVLGSSPSSNSSSPLSSEPNSSSRRLFLHLDVLAVSVVAVALLLVIN